MSIDAQIKELTDALNRNTAALERGSSAAPAVTTTTTAAAPTKGAKAAKPAVDETPKVSQEQMNAALIKLKDTFGMDEAKPLVKEYGKADKMADIKPTHFKAVYDAACARFDELTAESENGNGDGL